MIIFLTKNQKFWKVFFQEDLVIIIQISFQNSYRTVKSIDKNRKKKRLEKCLNSKIFANI